MIKISQVGLKNKKTKEEKKQENKRRNSRILISLKVMLTSVLKELV